MNNQEFQELKASFAKRNIEVIHFETLVEAKRQILADIPGDATVGIGHSATLQKMEITGALIRQGTSVYDKELGESAEARKAIKKKALTSDWYITGTNAISKDGRIVNIDHSGNRVAAMLFGPENVIIVVGKNKITENLDEAIRRARNVAAPKNAKRAGFNPPCVALNQCVNCSSEERVCNSLSIIEGQVNKNRMRLFIINEEAGF